MQASTHLRLLSGLRRASSVGFGLNACRRAVEKPHVMASATRCAPQRAAGGCQHMWTAALLLASRQLRQLRVERVHSVVESLTLRPAEESARE